MYFQQLVMSFLLMSFSGVSMANTDCPPGALVIAHGSHGSGHRHGGSALTEPHDHWNETVIKAVSEAQKNLEFPIELAFGMWDKESFDEGVQKLAQKGVCELRIIPLFISSDSEMVDIQKYMFGVNEKYNLPIQVGKVDIPPQIKSVLFGKALDSHEFVTEILQERITDISHLPEKEGIIFIAHGPYGDLYEPRWIELLKTHGERIQKFFLKNSGLAFNNFSYFTLRDDSVAPIRDERTRLIREKVESLNQKNITPILIPVLLSSGGIEKGIFERLKGLEYKMQDQFLMPHQRIIDWISYRAQNPKGN